MCQYQIKTMSIDWKIIIVAVLCIENIKSAMPHRAKSAYSFASNGQNMVNAAIKHGRCINNATVGYFHTESEEERGKERERERAIRFNDNIITHHVMSYTQSNRLKRHSEFRFIGQFEINGKLIFMSQFHTFRWKNSPIFPFLIVSFHLALPPTSALIKNSFPIHSTEMNIFEYVDKW